MPCIARFGTIFVQFKNHEKHPWQGVTFSKLTTFIVGTHTPPFGGGGWVEPPTKCSKGGRGGGLTGPHLLEGVAGKERLTFFRGGCNFYIKIN